MDEEHSRLTWFYVLRFGFQLHRDKGVPLVEAFRAAITARKAINQLIDEGFSKSEISYLVEHTRKQREKGSC